MNNMKRTAAVLAAMLFAGMMTGCTKGSSGGDTAQSSAAETASSETAAETAAVNTETEAAPAETSAPASEAEPEVCGKWAVTTYGDHDICAGQYGAERYASLYQMELNAGGEALFYDRSLAHCAAGTWEQTAPDTLHLCFSEDERPYLGTLLFAATEDETVFDLQLSGDTMTAEDGYGGVLVIEKTAQFAEREHPEAAWLTGKWVCDESKSDAKNPPTPLSSMKWDVSTIGDGICMHIAADGENYEFYFGQLQDDNTVKLVVDFPEDKGYPFAESVISQDGGSAVWKIDFNGYGTLTMKKAE